MTDETDQLVMSAAAVESAAWTARAVTTSTVLEEVHPDGTVNDDYPYIGFWARFTSSLENRWRIIKKEHREEAKSYEEDDATGQTKLVTDGGQPDGEVERCRNCSAHEAGVSFDGDRYCSVFCAEVCAGAVSQGVLSFD